MTEGYPGYPGYPIVLNVARKLCVIAGGGPVAERKAAGLLEAGADVLVVAPAFTARLLEWAGEGTIRAERREAEADDLNGAALAFAATDKRETNRWFAAEARRRGIHANVADEGDAGDFMTPAVVRRGDLLLAVSASGAGPGLPVRVARELAERYGPEYADLADALRAVREKVKSSVPDSAERRRLLRAAVTDEAVAWWLTAGAGEETEPLLERLRRFADAEER